MTTWQKIHSLFLFIACIKIIEVVLAIKKCIVAHDQLLLKRIMLLLLFIIILGCKFIILTVIYTFIDWSKLTLSRIR